MFCPFQHRIEAVCSAFSGRHVDLEVASSRIQNRRIGKRCSATNGSAVSGLAQHGTALPHLGLIAVQAFADDSSASQTVLLAFTISYVSHPAFRNGCCLNVSRENKAVCIIIPICSRNEWCHPVRCPGRRWDAATIDIVEPGRSD